MLDPIGNGGHSAVRCRYAKGIFLNIIHKLSFFFSKMPVIYGKLFVHHIYHYVSVDEIFYGHVPYHMIAFE